MAFLESDASELAGLDNQSDLPDGEHRADQHFANVDDYFATHQPLQRRGTVVDCVSALKHR
jgi:hypothetical protein